MALKCINSISGGVLLNIIKLGDIKCLVSKNQKVLLKSGFIEKDDYIAPPLQILLVLPCLLSF
jgi:hypothetical protein